MIAPISFGIGSSDCGQPAQLYSIASAVANRGVIYSSLPLGDCADTAAHR
jgi:hypothetical protein